MPELHDVLDRLGLAQYLSSLVDNGFESWETVLDITEDDLRELGFKIGHRRSLQREIASYRGIPATQTLLSDIETPRADSSSPLPSSTAGLDAFPFPAQPPTPSKTSTSASSKEGKRRYRRHPKPDQHAPKKPRTAYVNFADNLRLDPAVSSLSFVDIAREVGRRWQTLPPDEKHRWECAAARAMQEYEMQMEAYKKTDLHQRYQEYLDDFRRKQQLAQERKDEKTDHEERPGSKHDHDYPDRADSGSPMSLGSVATPEMDKYNESMSIAMKDLEMMRQEVLSSGIQLFDAVNLPPDEIVRGSALTFLGSTSSAILAWPAEQVHMLLARMYDRNRRPDPMTLAEGFILAALGGYYNAYGVNDMMRKTLHASATALFNHHVPSRSGYLRSMRSFLCLAYYSTLEKHLSGRQLACAGLQLARWKHPEFSRLPDGDTWRRVYRTLVFLDAWISSTLGFPASTTAEDVSNVCSLGLAHNSASDAIQYYSTSIMVIAAEISNVLRVPEKCTPENVKHSLTKIEHWNRSLHPVMQLRNITPSQAPLNMDHQHRQAALMVHILYLTTIIQLYAHLLSASASPQIQASWTPTFLAEIRSCHRHTASAAAQIAHLLALLNASPGDQRRRWWLRIHASYTAGVALLYAAGMKMLNAEEAVGVAGGAVQAAERVDEDLRLARECLDSLGMSAACDPAAAHLLNLLRPLYNTLDTVLGRSTSASSASSPMSSLGGGGVGTPGGTRGKSSIYALLDDGLNVRGPSPPRPTGNLSRLELLPAVEALGGLLRDPSGRLREGWIGGEWI